ncbi:FAD-dependent oxidoreductase [Oribacterium sp. WCC10]|uniref:FAD-dependent oxidoreductase n=1 Tax=Oribacterium sp. WCC10 TaxID=1855343 RepID=UPI0008E610E5|nr:FAD-dependent oxidoreductase [Oribacterium sp. WCC10]SFG66918.1 fumarate reductase flavoprotein subunit/urocanate reductase [Oribacterium sp. WCC10]
MRRIMTASLAVMMLMGSVTGCGGSSEVPMATTHGSDAAESLTKEIPNETSSAVQTMTSGTYNASAQGMDGEIQIAVTVTDDKIENIEIIDDNETAGVGDKALQLISEAVIKNQSLAVDSVSGATVSSGAIKLAIANALEQAGADVAEWKQRTIEKDIIDEDYTYDVVVVGAGFSGIQAAAKASSEGANVALIEKLDIVGGTSIFSSGAFVAAFTEEEVPEKMQIWVDRNTQYDNKIDLEKLKTAMGNSPEIISDFTGMGVNGKPFMETGWGVDASEKALKNASAIELADAEVHPKGGEYLLATLMNYIEKNNVDVFTDTPATRLLSENGNVTGVECDTDHGVKKFHAKAVVLATGTYARNKELCRELDPGAEYNFTAACVGDTGDGIIMARELGADVYSYQHKMSGIFAPDPYDMPVVGQPWNSYPYDCLLINSKAERPVSETVGTHFQMEYFIEKEAPDYGWVVMDQGTADRFLNLDKYLEATKNGSAYLEAYQEDSLEKLAEDMGVDVNAFLDTVSHYNEMCKAGEDKDFRKDARFLDPIDDGTYYAVKEYDMTRGEYGGIVTNDKAQVMTAENKPIEGLYAAGLISSGDLIGDFYPGMEALGVDAYMGYIAGREAAEHAKK